MKGQKSAIGSLPETLGFDHGSTSSDAGIDQQICWNNMRNSAHNMLPDYLASTSHPGNTYLNMNQGGPNLSGWNVGEPSSSGIQNHVSHDERKTEYGWSSSSMVPCGGGGPVSEEQQYEPANTLSLNNVNVNHSSSQISNLPLFVQSSSNAIPQDFNMNAGFVGHGGDDCQVMDCSNAYKSDVSETTRIPSASSSSNPFGLPYGSGGYMVEENDGRPGCPLEGRHLSCKRKALEVNTGQSSMSGSSSYFQPVESNVWHAIPGQYNAGSSLSVSNPSENILHVGPSEQEMQKKSLKDRRTIEPLLHVEGDLAYNSLASLPCGIIQADSDLELKPPWSTSSSREKVDVSSSHNLLAIPVGIKQKSNVDVIVQKFLSKNFTIILFHYDGNMDGWWDLPWSKNATHIVAQNQSK